MAIDFPVPNELISKAALHICFLLHCTSAEENQTLKHALHQLIHDYNGELAKSGFGKVIPKGTYAKTLNELKGDTVSVILAKAGSDKMRDSLAYAHATLTLSLCVNQLEKIARAGKVSNNGAVSQAVDELQHKLLLALDEFQRPFNVNDDGNIGL